jgi:hypothetical protein
LSRQGTLSVKGLRRCPISAKAGIGERPSRGSWEPRPASSSFWMCSACSGAARRSLRGPRGLQASSVHEPVTRSAWPSASSACSYWCSAGRRRPASSEWPARGHFTSCEGSECSRSSRQRCLRSARVIGPHASPQPSLASHRNVTRRTRSRSMPRGLMPRGPVPMAASERWPSRTSVTKGRAHHRQWLAVVAKTFGQDKGQELGRNRRAGQAAKSSRHQKRKGPLARLPRVLPAHRAGAAAAHLAHPAAVPAPARRVRLQAAQRPRRPAPAQARRSAVKAPVVPNEERRGSRVVCIRLDRLAAKLAARARRLGSCQRSAMGAAHLVSSRTFG